MSDTPPLLVHRSRRCPGLYYVPSLDTSGVPEFVESERSRAEPVASVTGKVGKDPRYRLDYGAHYGTNGSLGPARAIPPTLKEFLDDCDDIVRLLGIKDVPESRPDQCLINFYPPGKGIGAHTDHPKHFGSVIFCATFGASRTMRFTKDEETYDIRTEPGSLYVMSGEARHEWKHEMLPTTEECYSVTARYLSHEAKMATRGGTKVRNVKVEKIRPLYDNLKEWMADPENVYIGRAGIVFVPTEEGGKERCPKQDSPWANPYKVDKDGTREEVIEKYRKYIMKKIRSGELDIEELRGKTLGCWCKPEKCHGDVLVDILNS
jgi:alkylated DNA repair dioxygenase AlkB